MAPRESANLASPAEQIAEPTVIRLELDARRAVCPLPVVIKGLLKILLRRYGCRCISCRLEPEIGSKPGG